MDLAARAGQELAAFHDRYYGGYSEGDPLDPMTPSGYMDAGYISILHACHLVCIKPYVGPATRVLEIGPGRGSWTRCFLAQGAARIDCVDAMPAERNRFHEHVGHHAHVHYHVATDFSLGMLADAQCDYFFSYGVFCHISPPLVELYFRALARKLAPGAHGFVLVADYDKYNRFLEHGAQLSVKRAVRECFPGNPGVASIADDPRTHFSDRYRKRADEDDQIDPNRFYHLGAGPAAALLRASGFEVVSEDVGVIPRDPILHFRKPER